MKVHLLEIIQEGETYLDIYGQVWKAVYNKRVGEVQLWRSESGFGLWLNGENIVRRI